MNFEWNFIEVYSEGSNWQYSNIGSDNGLAPNRRRAIIWTNADPIRWRIYVALREDELIYYELNMVKGTPNVIEGDR